MGRLLLVYSGLRLLWVVLIAGILIAVGVPALVAVLIALVLGFALSLVLLRGPRERLGAEMAAARARRRAERERLRRALRGDEQEP